MTHLEAARCVIRSRPPATPGIARKLKAGTRNFGSGHSFTTAAEAHISEVTAMAVTLRAMMVTASQPTIRNAAGMV
jgi:hypothetical protein